MAKKKSEKVGAYSCTKYAISKGAKALAYAKWLRSLINVEFKYKNTQITPAVVTTAGSITQLTDIDQGDTVATRNGNSVLLKNWFYKAHVYGNASGGASQQYLIMCFIWNDDTAPTLADLLDYASPLSPINKEQSSKFRILSRKAGEVSVSTSSSDFGRMISFRSKLRRLHAKWTDGTGSNYIKGNIFVLLLSDQATNGPTIELTARVNYIDN